MEQATLFDQRQQPREEVYHRARAYGGDGQPLSILIVNLSAAGLMARSAAASHHIGERLIVTLPVIGPTPAIVRWALGGRIGCELQRPIGMADYFSILAAIAVAIAK